MATDFDSLKALIERCYRETWAEWYASEAGHAPAKIEVTVGSETPGYWPSKDLLRIPVPSGDLEMADVLSPSGWPGWRIDLIHEMLHEFAAKAVSEPDKCGKALHALPPNPVWGDCRHDEKFMTAVCKKASAFGLTPEELLDRI